MRHFMMAGCNHQVVEHIIRSSQCLSVLPSVRYCPLGHNKHTVIAFCCSAQYHECPAVGPLQLLNMWPCLLSFLIAIVWFFCSFASKCFCNFMSNYIPITKALIKLSPLILLKPAGYVMLCYVMLCYVMLFYVMLCYVMLCYVMLCYVMLCYVLCHTVFMCFVLICEQITRFTHTTNTDRGL
jgi:hypothetical protein